LHRDDCAGNLKDGFAETVGGKKDVNPGGGSQQAEFDIGQENDAVKFLVLASPERVKESFSAKLIGIRQIVMEFGF